MTSGPDGDPALTLGEEPIRGVFLIGDPTGLLRKHDDYAGGVRWETHYTLYLIVTLHRPAQEWLEQPWRPGDSILCGHRRDTSSPAQLAKTSPGNRGGGERRRSTLDARLAPTSPAGQPTTITSSLHESLEGLGRRVGNLEQNMDQHVENTTKLLGAMTDRHCDIENTVKKVSDSYDDVRRRLEL